MSDGDVQATMGQNAAGEAGGTSGKPFRPRIRLVAPYFGRLPRYMPIFLASCAKNPTIDWYLPSDSDWSGLDIPPNVTVVRSTLAEVRERAEAALGCPVVIPRPYKLCDMRPMYGVVFRDALKGYDFWGHCDLDVVWGDIRAFLPQEELREAVRLFENGHLCLYRNDERGNNLYRMPHPEVNYREVMADPVNRVFDEMGGINRIIEANPVRVYRHFRTCASISPDRRDFWLWGESGVDRPRVYVWRKGRIFRESYGEDGQLDRTEFGYLHFMRRHMVLASRELLRSCDHWLIVPNMFVPTDEAPLTADEMREVNKPSWEHVLRVHLRRPLERYDRWRRERALRKQYGRPV